MLSITFLLFIRNYLVDLWTSVLQQEGPAQCVAHDRRDLFRDLYPAGFPFTNLPVLIAYRSRVSTLRF